MPSAALVQMRPSLVEPEAVEQAGRAVGEDLAAGHLLAALADIEHPHMGRVLRAMRAAGIDDIELALVEREGEAVRPTMSVMTASTSPLSGSTR